jgi:hypothetical protein
MIGDIILIVLAGLIVASVGLPFVKAYSKWKKEMEAEEGGREDVSDR